jgi:hypothetical protein
MMIYPSHFGGLKSCLIAWKSPKADSKTSPKGFHELRQGFIPLGAE